MSTLRTIRYPQAGIAVIVNPWLSLGGSYRGKFNLVSDLTIRLQGNVGSEDSPLVEDGFLELRSLVQDLFQPPQWTVGARIDAGGGWIIAIDASLQRWSTMPNPSSAIDVDADLGQFNDLVEIPIREPARDPNFHDVLVPRIGVEGPVYRGRSLLLTARTG